MKQKPWIAPSLLSANFSCLADEIKAVQEAGADWLHWDIMDGHFVPNLTFGPAVMSCLRPVTHLPFDCHLMVSEPEKWIEPFAKAGANSLTVHVESTNHLDRVLSLIRDAECKVGVSLNPATSLDLIAPVLDQVDLVLLMSVNPGYSGQKFIPYSVEKLKALVKLRASRSFLIEMDGGIHSKNIGELSRLGADIFVVGSALFSSQDRRAAMRELKKDF